MKFTNHLKFWIREFVLFFLVAAIILTSFGAFGSLSAALGYNWKFIFLSIAFVLAIIFFGALLSYLTERWKI